MRGGGQVVQVHYIIANGKTFLKVHDPDNPDRFIITDMVNDYEEKDFPYGWEVVRDNDPRISIKDKARYQEYVWLCKGMIDSPAELQALRNSVQ